MQPRLEFRIPISPTEAFFAQVRFFELALRRLGGPYEAARLVIVVGDKCDLETVKAGNAWSSGRNIAWERTPDHIYDRYGWLGTADWRFLACETDADIVILSDADTVLVRDVDPVFPLLLHGRPAIAGHMAHLPPPLMWRGETTKAKRAEIWQRLFRHFGILLPGVLYDYSMGRPYVPKGPAYFNLGFVALNRSALDIFRDCVFDVQDQIISVAESVMRSQIGCTIIAYREGIEIHRLPAAYNSANDEAHFEHNALTSDSIRVIHYLRKTEIDRTRFLLPEGFDAFLIARLENPVNQELQRLARLLAPMFRGEGVD